MMSVTLFGWMPPFAKSSVAIWAHLSSERDLERQRMANERSE